MASPSADVLDFARLLAPIAGDKPTGTDLRTDTSPTSIYHAIRDARRAARLAERPLETGEADRRSPPAVDWRPVLEQGAKALAEKSKDLEVTAYLIEALVRLKGFAGLRDGLRLARELVEKYWDGLYPTPDEEGLATRTAPLIHLNGQDADGTLLAPIGRIAITEATSVGRFSTSDFHDASALKKLDPKAAQARMEKGAVSFDALEKAVAESSPQFYQQLVEDVNACIAQLAKMGAVLDQRCNGQGAPTSAIRGALEASLSAIRNLAQAKLETAPQPADGGAAAGETPAAAAASPSGDGKAQAKVLRTREDAFRNLLEIAEFFRRTEPQTIVAFAIEQVVRWGRMPLPDLLVELIPEEPVRKNLFKQVGIQPPGKGGDTAKK